MTRYSYKPNPINGLTGNDLLWAWETILTDWPDLLVPDEQVGEALEEYSQVHIGSVNREDHEIASGVVMLEQIARDLERARGTESALAIGRAYGGAADLSRSWSFGVRDDGLTGARVFPSKARWNTDPAFGTDGLRFNNLLPEGADPQEAASMVRTIDRWTVADQRYSVERILRTGLTGKQYRRVQPSVSYRQLFPKDYAQSSPVSAVFFSDTAEAPATIILRRID